jgi:hypothetical protein
VLLDSRRPWPSIYGQPRQLFPVCARCEHAVSLFLSDTQTKASQPLGLRRQLLLSFASLVIPFTRDAGGFILEKPKYASSAYVFFQLYV